MQIYYMITILSKYLKKIRVEFLQKYSQNVIGQKLYYQQLLILIYALKRSDIKEVDEDRNMVKRRIPFIDNSNFIDERTIYIENIPIIVDQQLLHQIISRVLKVKKFVHMDLQHFLTSRVQTRSFKFEITQQGDYGDGKWITSDEQDKLVKLQKLVQVVEIEKEQ